MWMFVCLLLPMLAPQVPVREAPPSKPPSAAIRGRIIDSVSHQPIAGASVMLRRGGEFQTAITDAEGRYEFTALAGGKYVLLANGGYERATHLTHAYGDDRPAESVQGVMTTSFDLGDGELRTGVEISLLRALAIDGRIIDPDGEPMSDIEVTATLAGGPQWLQPIARTDDRGTFRLFGLPPGTYRVCAKALRRGSSYLAASEESQRPATTCFLDAPTEATAEAVELGGPSAPFVEIRMQRHAAFSVSGTIVDAAGAPVPNAFASLIRLDGEPRGAGARVDDGGRFRIGGVTRGRYMLSGAIASSSGPPARGAQVAAYVPVTIEGASVDGLIVTIAPGARVRGRVTFVDGPPPPASSLRMLIDTAMEPGPLATSLGRPPYSTVTDALAFELVDIFFPVVVTPRELPSGWAVHSIRYRGNDITGVATRFDSNTDPRGVEILLTNQVAELSGRVLDERGAVLAMACVFAMPSDPPRPFARWAAARAWSAEGTYRFSDIKAGTYLVAALPAAECMRADENVPLDRLSPPGQPVTLATKERRVVDLQVSHLPEQR